MQRTLTDISINITTEGRKHLRAVAGSDTYKVQHVEDLINNWITQLKLLSSQPQAAYLAFVSGF